MPVMDGMAATSELRKLDSKGKINLSGTKIYMHSAIQSTIEWKEIFDGKCNLTSYFINAIILVNKPVNF